nr:protein pgr [Quercus suber]
MSVLEFVGSHIPQILATSALVTYAQLRNKLTPGGIAAGIFVAVIHMLHPWAAFFWLPILFFFLGTLVTRIGHSAKAHLTLSSTGGTGDEGARTSAQVFANCGTACLLILLHAWLAQSTPYISSHAAAASSIAGPHLPSLQRVLPIGIIAQYAAVAADTFSSELGILSRTSPFLITAPWKRVPKGTNGGVTIDGLFYGALGGFLLTATATFALRVLPPYLATDTRTTVVLTLAGLAGSVIDSVLGALVQATVTDKQSGRVVEGPGGTRVRVAEGGSRVLTGADLLTNNGVNFVMAALTSLGAMLVASLVGLGI